MKTFLSKFLIFISPVVLVAIIETFVLPPHFFTLRCGEALSFSKDLPKDGTYYPNFEISMHEKGDLMPHILQASAHATTWKTDRLGFRNDSLVSDPDILLIGDSFLLGVSLDQSQTLSRTLATMLDPNTKIYSMASFTFNEYYSLQKRGLFSKPKMIIYVQVERDIPQPFDSLSASIPKNKPWVRAFKNSGMSVIADRLLRFYSIEAIKAPIKGHREDMQSPVDAHMYFLQGPQSVICSKNHLEQTAKSLRSFKKYCDSQHIHFLYIPMPNKETVYYDLVPFQTQPHYLLQLDSLLCSQQIPAINTLRLYNEQRNQSPALLYQLNDTHWNANAVKLVAAEIVKRLPDTFQRALVNQCP